MAKNILECSDRVVKTVEPMTDQLLLYDQFVDSQGNIDIKVLIGHLKKEGRLHPNALIRILKRIQNVLRKEMNIIRINGPTAIFGDIHGQFYDLCNIFQDFESSDESLLFLGDYVDRGCFGTEVCTFLFCLKLQYPNRVHLLRGNHECRLMTTYFNFRQECLWKYTAQIYDEFMNTFDCLPLCGIVNSNLGSFFCVHGGISPSLQKINDINYIDRFQEPPEDGLFCDLLWSDPMDDSMYEVLSQEDKLNFQKEMYEFNSVRGCSYCYGFAAVRRFLIKNDLVCIVRGHEVQRNGCKMNFEGCSTSPIAITIFSAPNYCDCYDNDAAVLMVNNDELSFLSYNCVSHPFWLPKFANAFYYTLPLLIQQMNTIASRLFSAIIFESIESLEDKSQTPELSEEDENTLNQIEKALNDPHNKIINPHSRIAKTANRRRTLVGSTLSLQSLETPPTSTPPMSPQQNQSKSRLSARDARLDKRSLTLGLKTDYSDTSKTEFHVEASSRFELAKKNDILNELRPVEMKELRKEWQKLKDK
ncbi:calcineurin catalytic subunit A, putative [Entamoeba histolytica HM-1:IMSS-B]|uniref:Serine/threonine-protein phosphatase n=6 Tax=Entamoeba histolytica TaxID=5759 RepID=C4MAY5_ENTH1|nr:calcineurin catalytic subunit A, putative [Entamoeba histolytica HM-1:IMSS]EMD48107.1 serine/threonine protein phosphatase catalytic subunit, putative [Entamoeba histolytica KU27]EMH72920.1 calcineurin catalytic subunit A, putative [Entamoeba histolytica HM-1:IMSS-B]EMS15114.1 serine/threonine protein phosphatase 2B catalytic subunit, putative [Entamoeba histolytica HM-3:IMSS]ENY62232.1 calcineurin catalytic subunit A, putative [Entamoeba histolytica HM-1:IMSS-A]GAT99033.1 calcineurin catal|eukprot:XP_653904.2 calcineurin catalytic subunit A, putative [Entamoeba histolytica HM-1:IMSS]